MKSYFLSIITLVIVLLNFNSNLFCFEVGGYKFYGNNWLGLEFGSIDNDYYKTVYSDGIADGINLHNVFFLQTRINDYFVTGMGNFILNNEDVTFRKIFIEAADDNKIFNLGDIYPQETELSINNIRIRGLKAEYTRDVDVEKYRYNRMKPLFLKLHSEPDKSIRLPSYYYSQQNAFPFIENMNFKLLAGYAHTSTIVNKTKGFQEPPDQLFAALRTNFDLIKNNSIGLGLIFSDVQDNVPGYNYEKGNSFSIDYKTRINSLIQENDDLEITAEFANSSHNLNKSDTISAVQDNAYFGQIRYNLNNWGISTRYYSYGSDFKTMGNPYLQTNRQGILSELNYSICQTYFFDLFFESYESDKSDTEEFQKTMVINPSLRFNFENAPDWFLSYQTTDVDGENNIDLSSKKDLNLGVRFSLSDINFNVNYNSTDYDDNEVRENSYKSSGYSLSANYSLFNNRLSMFHYFYTDNFDYESDTDATNIFITLNGNYQLIPDKVSLNANIEYRSSKSGGQETSNIFNNEFTVDYIIDYSKQLLFKLRYTNEDYKNEDIDNKILALKMEYRINF